MRRLQMSHAVALIISEVLLSWKYRGEFWLGFLLLEFILVLIYYGSSFEVTPLRILSGRLGARSAKGRCNRLLRARLTNRRDTNKLLS